MLETSFALSIVGVREGMRRVSPLREFLSSLLFLCLCVCVCVCMHRDTEREKGGGRNTKDVHGKIPHNKCKNPSGTYWHSEEGGRKREGEGEGESGREEHSVHCAAHVDMCEQGAKGARGAHHASHSLTHSLPLSPLSPHLFCERESAREEETKRERGEKEKDTCKDLFFAMSFFLHSLSH